MTAADFCFSSMTAMGCTLRPAATGREVPVGLWQKDQVLTGPYILPLNLYDFQLRVRKDDRLVLAKSQWRSVINYSSQDAAAK
jgi:hypothetical protein